MGGFETATLFLTNFELRRPGGAQTFERHRACLHRPYS